MITGMFVLLKGEVLVGGPYCITSFIWNVAVEGRFVFGLIVHLGVRSELFVILQLGLTRAMQLCLNHRNLLKAFLVLVVPISRDGVFFFFGGVFIFIVVSIGLGCNFKADFVLIMCLGEFWLRRPRCLYFLSRGKG